MFPVENDLECFGRFDDFADADAATDVDVSFCCRVLFRTRSSLGTILLLWVQWDKTFYRRK